MKTPRYELKMKKPRYAFSHKAVWWAIDELARNCQRSPSGLAVAAGLDATALNKSKRLSPSGQPRWPNLDTIARLLAVDGYSLGSFAGWVFNAPTRRKP